MPAGRRRRRCQANARAVQVGLGCHHLCASAIARGVRFETTTHNSRAAFSPEVSHRKVRHPSLQLTLCSRSQGEGGGHLTRLSCGAGAGLSERHIRPNRGILVHGRRREHRPLAGSRDFIPLV